MSRRFTGWHMTVVLIAMFGTILSVNLVMARFAIATFGGTVVDNSYVATRHYDRWLAEAEAQQLLGWRIATTLDAERLLHFKAVGPDGPVVGVLRATASHPLGRAPDRLIEFQRTGDGRYVATRALPPGRWKLRVSIRRGEVTARFAEEIRS